MAYITAEYLNQFAEDRSFPIYEYEKIQIDSSIIVAADFINAYYTFKTPLSSYSVLPEPIQQANAMAAVLHLQGLLLVNPSTAINGVITSEEKELKGLKKKVTYDKDTASLEKMRTPLIDGLLKPYLVDENAIQAFSVGRRC